ncbi:hypothetical protein FRC11_011931, partial [Ceratobasidium sp. 423]
MPVLISGGEVLLVYPLAQVLWIRSTPVASGRTSGLTLMTRSEDLERCWWVKEVTLATATSEYGVHKVAAKGKDEMVSSDEDYTAAKIKLRGLGLVRFIGELFQLQIMTESIIHERIEKLLPNVVNPEEGNLR